MNESFIRAIRIEKTDIKTIEDVNDLKQKCDRYLELDKDIFEDEDLEKYPVQRAYSFKLDIQPNSFNVNIEMKMDKFYNYDDILYIDYNKDYWKSFAIVINTIPTTLDKVKEFCDLHQEIFGVPTNFTDYMFTMPGTKKVFCITFNTVSIDETTVHSQN